MRSESAFLWKNVFAASSNIKKMSLCVSKHILILILKAEFLQENNTKCV